MSIGCESSPSEVITIPARGAIRQESSFDCERVSIVDSATGGGGVSRKGAVAHRPHAITPNASAEIGEIARQRAVRYSQSAGVTVRDGSTDAVGGVRCGIIREGAICYREYLIAIVDSTTDIAREVA